MNENDRIKLWVSADRKEVTCAPGGECGVCGSMTDDGSNQYNSEGNGGDGPILLMSEGKKSKHLSHVDVILEVFLCNNQNWFLSIFLISQ